MNEQMAKLADIYVRLFEARSEVTLETIQSAHAELANILEATTIHPAHALPSKVEEDLVKFMTKLETRVWPRELSAPRTSL